MAVYSPWEYGSMKSNESFQDARICVLFLLTRRTEMKCAGGVSGAVVVLTARVAKINSVGVNRRAGTMCGMMNVFTYGDLDRSNTMVLNKQVCGIIDMESNGFFPPC